jgi:peptidoglycan/LPS O-acetylase OafA/YrhL
MGTCIWATPDLLPWAPASLLWGFIATSYHLQFLLGIAAAIVVLKGGVPVPRFFLALGIVGFVCTTVLEDAGLIVYLGRASQLLYGGFAAVALVGMASGERIGLLRSGAGPVFTGTASYTIYLVHGPVIAAASRLLVAGGFLHAVPGWLMMVMLAATGAAAGIVVHLAVERPIVNLLRRASITSSRPREGLPSIDRPHRLAL